MEENEIFKGMGLWRLLIDDDKTTTLKQPKYKSTMEIGNVKVNNIKHFNWMQKFFWRIILGIKIKDIKE